MAGGYGKRRSQRMGGLMENYLFTETDGVTTLTIEQDIPEEYLEWSEKTWEQALIVLKYLAEA